MRFRCESVTDHGYTKNVSLSLVSSADNSFTNAKVQIEVMKDNKDGDIFIPLKEYYLDFTPVK